MSDTDLEHIPPLEMARPPRLKSLLDQTLALITVFAREHSILVKPETGVDGDVGYIGVTVPGAITSVWYANDIVMELASRCSRIGRISFNYCGAEKDVLHCGVVTVYDREVPREEAQVNIVVFPSETASMTRCGLGMANTAIELSEIRDYRVA